MTIIHDQQIVSALAKALEPLISEAVDKAIEEVVRRKVRTAPVKTAATGIAVHQSVEEAVETKNAAETRPLQPEENRLLNVKEVAAFLSIGKSTVWAIVQRGDLTAVRFGRCTRFWLRDVEGLVGAN